MNRSSAVILPILGPWLAQEIAAALPAHYEPLMLYKQSDYHSLLEPHKEDIQALLCTSGGHPVDANLIAALPNLRLVLNLGAGVESVDVAACQAAGIEVLTGAGINAVDVAELAMGMLIALTRRIHFADQEVRNLRWGRDRQPVRRLAGCRIGIAGMGSIGQAIAKRAHSFDMPVHYYSRRRIDGLPWNYEPSLHALAQAVDFLILALPGGEQTYHLVNADILKALGKDGYLLNVGRGTVVDEAALIAALEEDAIAGAALDVFEHEPHVPEALIASPKTLLQPHRGGFTVNAHEETIQTTLARLNAFFAA